MSQSPLARRYAKALAELCAESKNHAVIAKQLETFSETYKSSSELSGLLHGTVASVKDKREILNKLFSRFLFAPTTRNFVLLLLDKQRLALLPDIVESFNEMLNEHTGRVRATVSSATPLDKAELTRIQTALSRLTGKQVSVEAKVDPTLLGGVVTSIGNVVLDGSLKTQIANLREQLAAGH